MFQRLPLVCLWYMIAAVSISGVPLFSGFISKTITIAGAAEAHHPWLAIGMEIAAVGTFLSVGIKLPYFAFFSKQDPGMKLAPIPLNMHIAMGISGFLCFFIGIYPQFLYNLLPNVVEYVPYTPWHVLQSSILLGFTGLGFYIMHKKLKPEAKLNLDFDYIYRLVGRMVVAVARRPIEVIDIWWSEFYRIGGLKGLLKTAAGSAWFDKAAIDGVVDGSAYTVQKIGRIAAMTQTGRLQDYLSTALVVGLTVFALIWFL